MSFATKILPASPVAGNADTESYSSTSSTNDGNCAAGTLPPTRSAFEASSAFSAFPSMPALSVETAAAFSSIFRTFPSSMPLFTAFS